MFELYMAVDFWDDLLQAPFTVRTFRNMMRQFRDWGVKRIYWMDDGKYASSYWHTIGAPVSDNARITFEEVGEFNQAAARYAHEVGLEIYFVIKPFEMGVKTMAAYGSPKAAELRRALPMIGGVLPVCHDFVIDNPQYLVARNTLGLPKNLDEMPIRTIRLVKMDTGPTRVKKENLSLWVSDDNYNYRIYDRPFEWTESVETRPEVVYGVNVNYQGQGQETVRAITLCGLDIREPYVSMATNFSDNQGDFRNYYYKLVELYSHEEQPIPFTCGTVSLGRSSWSFDGSGEDFRRSGIHFDLTSSGVPSCNNPGFNAVETIGALDNNQGFLGIAKGKNKHLYGALCPAYPEARAYWLSWVRDCLHAGADGVEIRVLNHHDVWDWQAYGFNEPVVKEYKNRYGIDIRTEEFDRGKWRRLRGEFYSQFVREASKLVRASGKKFSLDVNNEQILDETKPQCLEIHWDWRGWISESLADAITVKGPFPETFEDREIRRMTEERGIPTALCLPNFWTTWLEGNSKERIVDHLLEPARKVGHGGWILYEAANVMRAKPDGSLDILIPEVEHVVKPYFQNAAKTGGSV